MTTRKPAAPEALDDAALWQRFTAGARPLRRGRQDPGLPEPALPEPAAEKAAVPAPSPRAGEQRGAGKVAQAKPAPRPPAPKPLEIGHHPPGVDNTRWSGLTRGQLRPERSLDLHGMTLARAHAATRAFIEGAARDGCRVVEIVTGLGERGEGKIRREFLHWINAPDLRPRVLALAHPHRANPGAVRLLLRRPKRG
jgi:DNA-nicking Smr family endonuclease